MACRERVVRGLIDVIFAAVEHRFHPAFEYRRNLTLIRLRDKAQAAGDHEEAQGAHRPAL